MDIAFTQQATSRVGSIEKPQTAEFLRPALMTSTIMEDLKKSMDFHLMVPNLLILSYSNATSFILE
jgi:hypothetical protein